MDKWGSVFASIGAATAATGLAATYYMSKMPDPTCIPPVDLDDQAWVLEVRSNLILCYICIVTYKSLCSIEMGDFSLTLSFLNFLKLIYPSFFFKTIFYHLFGSNSKIILIE